MGHTFHRDPWVARSHFQQPAAANTSCSACSLLPHPEQPGPNPKPSLTRFRTPPWAPPPPQDGAQQSGRETPAKLSAHAANFSHKALCAALFGALGLHGRSVAQLAALAVLQAAMLVYLALSRPYVDVPLQLVELGCHALELGLLVCGLALLGAIPSNGAPTTFIMVGESAVMGWGAVGWDVATLVWAHAYGILRISFSVRNRDALSDNTHPLSRMLS